MTQKKDEAVLETRSQSAKPEGHDGQANPASVKPKKSSTSGDWKLNLDLAGQNHLERGMQMMGLPPKSPVPSVAPEPEDPPSSGAGREGEEVRQATDNLAGIVDQMIPSFLMSLGLLDSAMKWLRAIAVGMTLSVLCGAFITVRIQDAAVKSERAAEDSARAVKELIGANKELVDLKSSLQSVMKEVQKVKGISQIEAQTSIQITAGDKPGEVNILAPQVTRAEIEKEKSKVEAAVEAGKPIPPSPSPYVTAKIPAQIKLVETTVGPPPQARPDAAPSAPAAAAPPRSAEHPPGQSIRATEF